MVKLGLTIGLVVAFFFSNPAWADDPNAILSKEDSAQMFAMSEAQWIVNVETLKASQIGDYRVAPTGEYTLYMRVDQFQVTQVYIKRFLYFQGLG